MSQIDIEIISVGAVETVPTKNGKSYSTIEVAYKKDGKIEGKKIMSFVNPAVFKAVKELKTGDNVTVSLEKNDQGYWQWQAIGTSSTTSSQSTGQQVSTTTKTGGNYETKEERAARQVMIVRQSSLTNAVATLSVGAKNLTPTQVIAVAKEYEAFVLSTSNQDPMDGVEDDIPL